MVSLYIIYIIYIIYIYNFIYIYITLEQIKRTYHLDTHIQNMLPKFDSN